MPNPKHAVAFTAMVKEFNTAFDVSVTPIFQYELIREEAKEVIEAAQIMQADVNAENAGNLMKEIGDYLYVVTGLLVALEYADDDAKEAAGAMLVDDGELLGLVAYTNNLITLAEQEFLDGHDIMHSFELVHDSNMSKLDDDGNPIRNEVGKVTKGPNYVEPDMSEVAKHVLRQYLAMQERAKVAA